MVGTRCCRGRHFGPVASASKVSPARANGLGGRRLPASDWQDLDVAAEDPIAPLQDRLPRHWLVLDALRSVVRGDERWRWFEVGCSLGTGGGDQLSDADVAIGYTDITDPAELEAAALSVAASIGPPIDIIGHRLDGWPDDVYRVAAEYDDGVQLDLVMMPARQRLGLPDRTIAIVDKDGHLVTPVVPRSSQPPSLEIAREWVFLGWWALSAADKYVVRGSWFEATESLAEARKFALFLYATGRDVPYPSYGLVSLLDFPPFALPPNLADTYCTPADPPGVGAALRACANLLRGAAEIAGSRLGGNLDSALADATTHRLAQHRSESDVRTSKRPRERRSPIRQLVRSRGSWRSARGRRR